MDVMGYQMDPLGVRIREIGIAVLRQEMRPFFRAVKWDYLFCRSPETRTQGLTPPGETASKTPERLFFKKRDTRNSFIQKRAGTYSGEKEYKI